MRHTDCEVNSVSGAMAAAEESECNYKLRKERRPMSFGHVSA